VGTFWVCVISCDRNKINLQNMQFTCDGSDLEEINDVGQERRYVMNGKLGGIGRDRRSSGIF
jgi:hypothetical protein